MSSSKRRSGLLYGLVAGMVGGIAWMGGLILFFGPAQVLLANSEYQSQKFLKVMRQIEPLPRVAESWWILLLGLLVIGAIYGIVYHFIQSALPGKKWWKKGIQFGLIAWALMVPWFEFYLPWNVMHEPVLLVFLEGILWVAVLFLVGISISGTYAWQINKQNSIQ